MAPGKANILKSMPKKLKKLYSRTLVNTFDRVDFLGLARFFANSESARRIREKFKDLPPAWDNQDQLSELAIDLLIQQTAQNGDPIDPQTAAQLIDEIRVRYDSQQHIWAATAIATLFDYLFDLDDPDYPFTSKDKRELAHVDQLQAHMAAGKGVVYLVNHSTHFDEFIIDMLWQHARLGLPLFAAGQNMMRIKSLGKLLNLGLYVVLRQGANRHQMAALYNYCRAISEIGGQQGIFLEAWAGGARTKDGSLRYPRRLVTLRGALDVSDDVVVQPIALSYSVVPEDLPLCARGGGRAWFRGVGFWRGLGKIIAHPKTFPLRMAENLYGRAYLNMPRPWLLSELKALHEADKGGLALDEFVSLHCIREIARSKKIMASQLVARGLVSARRKRIRDLEAAVSQELELIGEYHQSTFGHEPDLEDFIRHNPLDRVIADGLATLRRRGIISRLRRDELKLPLVRSEAGLSFYATHADRRIYSPTADQNLVVVGAGYWGFAIARLVGLRLLEDKRYNNASLTLFDTRRELVDEMNLRRTGSGRFSDVLMPKNIFVTHDLPSAFRKASEIIIASTPEDFEARLESILRATDHPFKLIIATRGLLPGHRRPAIVVARQMATRLGRGEVEAFALTGPVDPEEIVNAAPVKGILAGQQPGLSQLADLFNLPPAGVTLSLDPVGVQVADTMARIYAMWVNFVMRSDRPHRPQDVGRLMADGAGETRRLALAMGASEDTFRAGSPAFITTYVAASFDGDIRDFGRDLGRLARKQKDIPAAAQKLDRQMKEDGRGVQVLADLQLAHEAAAELGLDLPVLSDAFETIRAGKNDDDDQ